MSIDRMNWERNERKNNGDVVSNAIDRTKTEEAIKFFSGYTNVGGTGLSGADYVNSRGGLNNLGYFNDVPAYQQLTANERASVTLANGNINSLAMLALLNKKEEEWKRSQGIVDFNRGQNLDVDPVPLETSLIMPSSPVITTIPPTPVKTAPIDTILFDDESVSIDTMADLIFENIGGQELINITRSDIVNGQKISYQPIKNLSTIQQRYNSNNILSLQQTADRYFAGFSIKLEDKIPNEGNGQNGENIYIDQSTGDLVIEFINLNSDEQIEAQITVGGTIYEATL